jgi:hypothetical protein
MTTAMIVALIALCGWLGMRLHAARTENSELRTSIAQLKRRLAQRPL